MIQVMISIFDGDALGPDGKGIQFRAYDVRMRNGARSLTDISRQYQVSVCEAEDGRKGFVVLKLPAAASGDVPNG